MHQDPHTKFTMHRFQNPNKADAIQAIVHRCTHIMSLNFLAINLMNYQNTILIFISVHQCHDYHPKNFSVNINQPV